MMNHNDFPKMTEEFDRSVRRALDSLPERESKPVRRFSAKKIVCAYHAGQGNVDSWLKNPQYSADGVTLDVIPTQDTATYASRVLRARDVYQKYYFPIETIEPTEP